MKRVALVLIVGLISMINADDIDDLVKKIAQDRTSSVSGNELVNLKSPIARFASEVNSSKDGKKGDTNTTLVMATENSFDLTAIINKSAFINKKWVKKGEKIGSYTLSDVMDDSVMLKDGNKTKIIFFKPSTNKIKITGR